jgi:hypothetical protein
MYQGTEQFAGEEPPVSGLCLRVCAPLFGDLSHFHDPVQKGERMPFCADFMDMSYRVPGTSGTNLNSKGSKEEKKTESIFSCDSTRTPNWIFFFVMDPRTGPETHRSVSS